MKNRPLISITILFALLLFSCSNDDTPETLINELQKTDETNTVTTISVTDFTTSVTENTPIGTPLGKVTANASAEETISYTIKEQNPEGSISIDIETGELFIADASKFDFETNPEIKGTITAKTETASKALIFEITVENILDPTIEIFELKDLFAEENSLKETELAKVNATTTEGVIVYSLKSQSAVNALGIKSDTGIIFVNDGSVLDLKLRSTIDAEVVATVGDTSKSLAFSVEIVKAEDTTTSGFTIKELTDILQSCSWKLSSATNQVIFQPSGNLALNFSLHGPAEWKIENTTNGTRLFVQFGNGDNYDVYTINEIDSTTIEISFVDKVGESVPIDFNYFGGGTSTWEKICP